MIKKIYLDMDGVLTDFEKRFAEKFGYPAMAVRDRKNFSVEWPQFIEDKEFETLDWHPGGQELLTFIRKQTHITVEMLSSSGGVKHHDEVKRQKKVWLKKYGIAYKPNIVPGRAHKAKYAEPDVVLIDDTEPIITSFNAAGGIGILHKDASVTIKTLENLLNK
jgi:hypothetical protein